MSDIIFAAMPMFLIWTLSRSAVEKSLVSVLMASALFASACGCAKIYYLATFDIKSPDTWRDMVPQYLWCRMEEIVIVIAACAPLLKLPIEHFLRRLGLPMFQKKPNSLNVIQSNVDGSDGDMSQEVHGNVESKRSDSE